MEQYWWIIIAAVLIVVGLLKMVIMKKYNDKRIPKSVHIMMEISQPYMGHSTRSCCGCCGHVCDRTLFMREKYNLAA